MTMMEVYTLVITRIIAKQKEDGMSCKRMELTHSSKSNMMKMKKRLRENNSAKDTTWFEVTKHLLFKLIICVLHNFSKSFTL